MKHKKYKRNNDSKTQHMEYERNKRNKEKLWEENVKEIGQFGKNRWPIERYTSILSKKLLKTVNNLFHSSHKIVL